MNDESITIELKVCDLFYRITEIYSDLTSGDLDRAENHHNELLQKYSERNLINIEDYIRIFQERDIDLYGPALKKRMEQIEPFIKKNYQKEATAIAESIKSIYLRIHAVLKEKRIADQAYSIQIKKIILKKITILFNVIINIKRLGGISSLWKKDKSPGLLSLSYYFSAEFKGRNRQNTDYLNMLNLDLSKTWTDKDIARIALMIYNSKSLIKKPTVFQKWYELFCSKIGVKYHKEYNINKLAPTETIQRTFYYLDSPILTEYKSV